MFFREREREVDSTDTCSVCEATKENREKANEQQQKKNAGNRRNRTGRVIRIPSLEGPIQKKPTKSNKNKQTSMNEYEIKGTRQKRKQKRDSGTIGIWAMPVVLCRNRNVPPQRRVPFYFLNSVSIFSLLVLFRCSYFYVVFFFRLCARLFALLPAFVVTGFNGFFFDFPWFKMSEKKKFRSIEMVSIGC